MTAVAAAPTIRRGLPWNPGSDQPRKVEHGVSPANVCDLIDAAGPLSVCDIAGGLAVPVLEASVTVRLMGRRHQLKQDEFRRYRLWGDCSTR